MNVGLGKWRAKSNLLLVEDLRLALNSLKALTSVTIFWVPGHAGVFENEISDVLAKRGAEGITSNVSLLPEQLTKLRDECHNQQTPSNP